jgi:hypothetical protein
MLVKGKQLLLLIGYSYIQSSPFKVLAVIEERNYLGIPVDTPIKTAVVTSLSQTNTFMSFLLSQ